MNKIFWYGITLTILGIGFSLLSEEWFGGCLFGMGLIYILFSENLNADNAKGVKK